MSAGYQVAELFSSDAFEAWEDPARGENPARENPARGSFSLWVPGRRFGLGARLRFRVPRTVGRL